MKPFGLIISFFLAISMISGCASTPGQSGLADIDSASQVSSGPELPNIELTPDLLHELFVAEIALQRGQYQTAVKYYARLAKQTSDPRLVERAARGGFCSNRGIDQRRGIQAASPFSGSCKVTP